MNGTMMLISSQWQEKKSFRLIPIDNNSPYIEGIYDIDSKALVLMSRQFRQTYHLLPKMDEAGDIVKTNKLRKNGKFYKEERRLMDTFQEYYITDINEITDLINLVCINCKSFDYMQYLNQSEPANIEPMPDISLGGTAVSDSDTKFAIDEKEEVG